jgi:hypothetical protein
VGTEAQDSQKLFKDVPVADRPQLAVYELQHLILLIERQLAPESPLNRALMQHKLGLEVTLPKSALLWDK